MIRILIHSLLMYFIWSNPFLKKFNITLLILYIICRSGVSQVNTVSRKSCFFVLTAYEICSVIKTRKYNPNDYMIGVKYKICFVFSRNWNSFFFNFRLKLRITDHLAKLLKASTKWIHSPIYLYAQVHYGYNLFRLLFVSLPVIVLINGKY